MQTLFHKYLRRIDVEHSYFRREDQVVVICDVISGRTQTVPVEYSSHHIAVRKQD